jgi:hypothetical protein
MDGQCLLVDASAEWYECPEPPQLPADWITRRDDEPLEIKSTRYKRRVLNMGNGYFLDFFSPHEPGQQDEWAAFFALKRLLDYYSSREEREKAMQERFAQQEREIIDLRSLIFSQLRELQQLRKDNTKE